SDLQQLELLLGKGFQRHQPNSELGKGGILGMAVSAPGHGRAFAARAKSPQQDSPDGQCPGAPLQFPSLGSTGAGTRGKRRCHSRRSQVAPGDSGSSSSPTCSQQPPAKPAAPKRFQSLRRPW
ncbi:HES5 factor, partial [Pachycephala philippinensis]|nr:HES5 factor [Pachycephala philippinensis]